MIISFRFKNFRSFADETFMDMRAVGYKEHPSHLIRSKNRRLIKTLAVYGSNASGKTNLLLALASFHVYIYQQLFTIRSIGKNPLLSALHHVDAGRIVPFWCPEPDEEPIDMELSFISQGHTYEYGFSLFQGTVLTESLALDNHIVFTRTGDQIHPGRLYEKFAPEKMNLGIRSNCLFCTILSCMHSPSILEVIRPFEYYFSHGISYYFEFIEHLKLWENSREEKAVYRLLEKSEALNYALKHMRILGMPVEDVIYEHGIPKIGYRIRSPHTGESMVHYACMNDFSNGTLKLLSLFEEIFLLLKRGGTLVIDNISNDFHPAVIKYMVDLFQQETNENAQLVFTTYDVSILNNRQFRRDEVAFVDINQVRQSRLYTLADIKVRSDASFSKDYLLGKYGAIPMVREEQARDQSE